jgi:hypothetical protein
MYSETEAANIFVFFPYGSAVFKIYFKTPSKCKWKFSNFKVYLHHPAIRIRNILAYIYYQSSRITNMFLQLDFMKEKSYWLNMKAFYFKPLLLQKPGKCFLGYPRQMYGWWLSLELDFVNIFDWRRKSLKPCQNC